MTGGRSWGDFTGTFFKPTSIWNKPLPADIAIDPISNLVVAALADRALSTRHPQILDDGTRASYTGVCGMNYKDWNTPIHVAHGTNFTVQRVYLDRPYSAIPANAVLRDAWSAVPVPNDARPASPWPGVEGAQGANPGDNHLIIYQPNDEIDPVSGDLLPGDRMWEFWKARQHSVDGVSTNIQTVGTDPAILNADGWHAVYGGAMKHVSHNDGAGWNTNAWDGSGFGWGATASKLPAVGGLLRQEEALAAKAGDMNAIKHALRLHVLQGATPNALLRRDGIAQCRWPAYGGGDGASQYTYSPAEGDNFTLPNDYDPMTEPDTFMRAIITAVRDYGMLITDTAGGTTLVLEPRNTVVGAQTTQPDVWLGSDGVPGGDGIFSLNPSQMMRDKFPWDDLQLIDKAYRPDQPKQQRLIVGT